MEKTNKRYSDSIASKFSTKENPDCLILKACSDIGVRRNKGRNGARYAPLAIENALKKLNHHLALDTFHSEQVSYQEEEINDYDQAIDLSAQRIAKNIASPHKACIHIGGGHDHALPLLRALDETTKQNTLIINFDAHCDTRVDDRKHSGTPFRDFDRESKNKFHLFQVGIHEFANSRDTLSKLENNSEEILFTKDIRDYKSPLDFVDKVFESCPFTINEDTNLFISIDCDALSSSVMSAVSAVNHDGIEPKLLLEWIEVLKDFPCKRKVLGIYEYNPVFEGLSQKGSRYLAGLIYKYLS
ncbi:MAG: arginase family protein [Bacteriovoracaceae bacterium]|nr:arginase family protein [Bacteriovoracaceae bacterium]